MTNIEIRSKMKNEAKGMDEATYTGNYMNGKSTELGCTFVKRDFYLNLDTISSFSFGKIEEDVKVNVGRYNYHSEPEYITFEKGTPFVELSKYEDGMEFPYMMLTFLHEGEYQRTKRILTEKLCAK